MDVVRVDPSGKYLTFKCPGCGDTHRIGVDQAAARPKWAWNGSRDKPALSPSLLVTSGHYMAGHQGPSCWCTYNAEHPDDPSSFTCYRCHSFIGIQGAAPGQIQFLGDSTHALAGQTVDLPPVKEDE